MDESVYFVHVYEGNQTQKAGEGTSLSRGADIMKHFVDINFRETVIICFTHFL